MFNVEKAIELRGFVTNIGQLDYEAEKTLRRMVRQGHVEKVRAPWAGMFLMKTHYVADRERFEASQNADRAKFGLAIALDKANRRSAR